MSYSIQIDRSSPTPVFRHVEEQILKGIQNGDLKPGDRIPSQYELARECQVSRATVQKALDRLIQDELLYYQQGKGIFVATPPERQRLPILQSISKSLKVLGYKVHADLLLIEEIEASTAVCDALHLVGKARVIHIKRLQYANGEPLVFQEVFLEAERFRGVRDYDLRQEALTEIVQQVGDVSIKGSSVGIGAKEASWEEARILGIQAGTALITIEEIDYDSDDQPVRLSRNRMRSDRIRVVANTLNEYRISLEYRFQPGTVVIALF